MYALAGFCTLSIGDAIIKGMAGAWPAPAMAATRYVAGTALLAVLLDGTEVPAGAREVAVERVVVGPAVVRRRSPTVDAARFVLVDGMQGQPSGGDAHGGDPTTAAADRVVPHRVASSLTRTPPVARTRSRIAA